MALLLTGLLSIVNYPRPAPIVIISSKLSTNSPTPYSLDYVLMYATWNISPLNILFPSISCLLTTISSSSLLMHIYVYHHPDSLPIRVAFLAVAITIDMYKSCPAHVIDNLLFSEATGLRWNQVAYVLALLTLSHSMSVRFPHNSILSIAELVIKCRIAKIPLRKSF